jgi:protein gp37
MTARPQWTGEIRFIESKLEEPLHWKHPRKIFVNSMSDLFHEKVPDNVIAEIFAVMAMRPDHIFQILTKRAYVMRETMGGGIPGGTDLCDMVQNLLWKRIGTSTLIESLLGISGTPAVHWVDSLPDRWPLSNVWLGVSVEDQATADVRVPELLSTPAAVRWVSYEPALGSVDFHNLRGATFDAMTGCGNRKRITEWAHTPRLDWIVAGGESGPRARPADMEWFRSVRDQCQRAGVPFFFKQWGEWMPVRTLEEREDADKRACTTKGEWLMSQVGKGAAGRLLDGREWNDFPGVKS